MPWTIACTLNKTLSSLRMPHEWVKSAERSRPEAICTLPGLSEEAGILSWIWRWRTLKVQGPQKGFWTDEPQRSTPEFYEGNKNIHTDHLEVTGKTNCSPSFKSEFHFQYQRRRHQGAPRIQPATSTPDLPPPECDQYSRFRNREELSNKSKGPKS